METRPSIAKSDHKRSAGHRSEQSACELLLSKGYQIVARNVRFKAGEIDIIAKDGSILCFIEVRSRENSRFLNPKASVHQLKQKKIIKAASLYLQKHYLRFPICRFDVISIIGYGPLQEIELIQNAFEMTSSPCRRNQSPWQAF